MTTFELNRGHCALLISVPHHGVQLPEAIAARMTPVAHALADTDWFVADLYAPLAERLGASILVPTFSRYVVDLNRAPDGATLYPGRSETGLCPLSSFNDEPLYRPGCEPDQTEVAERICGYWQPYHTALRTELARLHALHGYVLLWDAHSIPARVPRFFAGRLPDLNFGTFGGSSASAEIEDALFEECALHAHFSHVFNGRFKGGYITRHYGEPARGIHAVQLELNQDSYMDAQQTRYSSTRAAALSATIEPLLQAALRACA